MNRRPGRLLVALVAAAALADLGVEGRARAAGDDVATAQVLFDDAKGLIAQGRFADACPKLQQSQKLAPAIGTEFNLADCWEHVGRLASAWAAFLDVVDQTHKRGETQREQAARTRAAALAPRLGHLTIQVPTQAPNLEVRRDGELVAPEVWGVAVPVDAGEHKIEARAPGRTPWTGRVTTNDGRPAAVSVPDLLVAATPAPAPAPAPATATAPTTATTTATTPATMTTTDHTAALIVLGSSVILAGVGVAGLLEHEASISNYNGDASCPPITASTRPAQCDDYVNQANTWQTVGIVGFVASGAALVAGVVLWVVAPRRTVGVGTASGFACVPGIGGVECGGVF